MSVITAAEINAIIKEIDDNIDSKTAKLKGSKLIQQYGTRSRNLEKSVMVVPAFMSLMERLVLNPAMELAIRRLNEDFVSPEALKYSDKLNIVRQRSDNADVIELKFCKTTLDIYHDMGLVSAADFDSIKNANVEIVDAFLAKIHALSESQELDFAERFVRKTNDINSVVPIILANAYKSLQNKPSLNNADQDLLNRIKKRIDVLSGQFASLGNNEIVKNSENTVFNYLDVTNVADTYDGYDKMFAVRLADFQNNSNNKTALMLKNNRIKANAVIEQYDNVWGLDNIENVTINQIEKRWDELNSVLSKIKITEDVKQLIAKYKFLDADGVAIPQFITKQGERVSDYIDGCDVIPDGRLAKIIDLAKHDVALMHTAKVNEHIDVADLSKEVNERIPLKLYEIDTADKIMNGASEHPNQFTNNEFLDEFIVDLSVDGGCISDAGYNASLDNQVNQTAGFAARLKNKIQNGSSSMGNLAIKLFKPLESIDKRADARIHQTTNQDNKECKRQKRIEFFKRILKGFGSAFLVSAALTTIATAAAATAGVSVAASFATIGIITGLSVSVLQIQKWRKSQQTQGLPSDITALLKDKRMLMSLGTTGIAAVAMVFGAAGLGQTAMALGYGALAIGGTTNAVQMYKDAKSSGMSAKESVAWSIANTLAVVIGGISGRGVAQYGIANYNQMNPENKIFQQEHHSKQLVEKIRTETRTSYTQDALDNAKRIAQMWYQDNPQQLQHRVDLINEYNATHGTTIDPYRAIVLNADAGGQTFDNMALYHDGGKVSLSGGNHKVFGSNWMTDNNFSKNEIADLKNLFNTDGTINKNGMDIARRVDVLVSAKNEVGIVSAGDVQHHDGVLPPNTVDKMGKPVYNTYAPVEKNPAFQTNTVEIVDKTYVDTTNYTSADNTGGMGMFGVNQPKQKGMFAKLRNRLGSFVDSVFCKTR
ncbi:MAG: hypothetical protein IJL05_03740 [Alphaproteobacteria bacterium]|nr:hypothetical protein [Alphaproteobacteria bacterium]